MDATPLQQLLDEWRGRLARIPEGEALRVVGSKWTRKQVLGHLIDSTANNHQRFVRLQQGNLAQFPGYDQEAWVQAGHYNERPWSSLVDLWYLYNAQMAAVIAAIGPECGGHQWEGQEASLDFIVADYTRHMLHHLHQLD